MRDVHAGAHAGCRCVVLFRVRFCGVVWCRYVVPLCGVVSLRHQLLTSSSNTTISNATLLYRSRCRTARCLLSNHSHQNTHKQSTETKSISKFKNSIRKKYPDPLK
jgi:hypothetical protein